MRLKRIKLAGFKSFVEPTSIPFPGSMTAVVGPNGCGKSNVIDAVRWVLGESSAKNLRGDAMTDVIFNGSSARKPVGQCSVELVFENAGQRLTGEYAKYAELSVKRIVTRDGQSNYFLNGTKCRRRDVTDLFLGTGLGPRSYAIIEQGMISRLIESKPQDLRVFVEEAAGISKYKERRRETETRIRHTTENLDRLSDVRSELGQQLAKLERQAAAAQRYTELKAKERTLKSELAMIRFLDKQHKLDELQQSLSQHDTEYEALKARLQGDEAGIESHRTAQTEKKLALDGVQQQLFLLATNITRAEEAQEFKQQRLQELKQRIFQLSTKGDEYTELQRRAEQELAQVSDSLAELEPQIAVLDEQHSAASENRQNAEDQLHSFTQQRRSADEAYYTKKRQAQTNHSQIQSTMSMQMRTQQRIKELDEEIKQLEDPMLQAQFDSLAEQTQQAKAQKHDAEQELASATETLESATFKRTEQDDVVLSLGDEYRQLEAKRQALVALQGEFSTNAEALPPLWTKLETAAGFEELVELVLSHWSDPAVVANRDTLDLVGQDSRPESMAEGKPVLFETSFVERAPAGTLAEKILSRPVPALFTRIHLSDTPQQATKLLAGLPDGHSVLTKNGLWLAQEWGVWGAGQQANGAIKRQADIDELAVQLEIADARRSEAQETLEQLNDSEHRASKHMQQIDTALRQAESHLNQVTQQKGLIAMQLEQSQARRQKLQQDSEQQELLLAQEQEQLERLSEQVETLEAEIFELETQQQSADETSSQLQQRVTDSRHQFDVITQRKHGINLNYQQCQSQHAVCQRDVDRLQAQRIETSEQLAQLKGEAEQLSAPEQNQSEQLQQWLQEKHEQQARSATLQQELSEIDDFLNKAQMGQQGLRGELEQKQKVRESLLLEAEGLKATANSILEQLNETGKSVKDTLATLPEQTDENQWAAQLEQTSAAIKRLGAVNLAAVEEFKVQAERKAHLDAQDADLNAALETLQTAIRKIDKETRTRFSDTFERVNSDLKSLFPKVFGGGSAYLALTDDDLLETGVTIMARPPGKKNSTIHLLSGGEKALTALSLVFAIFRLNPAPFCLLDEVDAPLDDANVGRFCNLVSEMSQTVQFIYITHNKIAMEMASHLTGVTMAEPGVSRMVAVDVDEAVTLAQA